MGETLEHKCGLVVAYTLHDAYAMIKDLQHRGKEAVGIAAVGQSRIDVLKWIGKVDRFDLEDLHEIFPGNDYHTFLAHVRYATRGQKEPEQILLDAHPHTLGGNRIEYGDHVLILDCDAAMVHNGQVDVTFLEEKFKGKLQTGCDTEVLLHYYHEVGERQLMQTVEGSYTLAVADRKKKDVMVMRDRTGIRVGTMGIKGGKHCVASEDVAIRKNGGQLQEDLEPGAIYYFDPYGQYRKERVIEKSEVEAKVAHCMFEYLYLAHPDSIINGHSVRFVRQQLGKRLAQEFHFEEMDYVTYVPRSSKAAALSYADSTGIPFMRVFYKPNSDRSFMGSTPQDRRESINSNFFLLPSKIPLISGKKLLAIDDSLVRGNVAKRVKELFDLAGVREAVLVSYTPPLGVVGDDGMPRGCVDGVDMPPDDDFIARVTEESGRIRNATPGEINQKAGMPVYYLSGESLNAVFDDLGLGHSKLCMYCIGGKRPYPRNDLIPLRRK